MWNHKTADKSTYSVLREYARQNRQHATLAEQVLWEHIRCKALGERFLRQHIIGEYIVDFVSQDSGLVIEVDGGYHLERQQQADDEVRTQYLERQGFHVIRFTNEEVLYDTDAVLDTILHHIEN